jgi:hypothetical protein
MRRKAHISENGIHIFGRSGRDAQIEEIEEIRPKSMDAAMVCQGLRRAARQRTQRRPAASMHASSAGNRMSNRMTYVASDVKDRLGLRAVLVVPMASLRGPARAALDDGETAEGASRWVGETRKSK